MPLRCIVPILAACAAAPALALDCPAMPQQASRDAEVEVRVGVRGLGDAHGAELTRRTRELTADLLSRLPNADRVYLEQMLYASYCSALKANAALPESEREARVRAYARDMRSALGGAQPAPRADPRDAARAALARLPVDYTADALVAAAARGDARVVGLFIQAGFDVNGGDSERVTALAHAAARGDVPMLTALLRAGARADATVVRIDSALSWAAYGAQPATLRALLAARPPPSAAAVGQAFVAAARKGFVAGMELLRAQGGVDLAKDGAHALRETATLEREDNVDDPAHVAAARRLIDWGVAVDAADEQGLTLLISAIDRGRVGLARLALQAGSPVDQRCDCAGILEGGFTPLTYALHANEPSDAIVGMLLERKADANARTGSGRTPLLVLLDGRPEIDMVRRLLAAGADPNAADAEGRTPLLVAAARHDAVAAVLLAAGARADARSASGTTPLMQAARAGAADSLQALLDAGSAVDARGDRGRTALMVAVLAYQRDAVRLLLQRGARPDLPDEDGVSARAHAEALPASDARTRLLTALRAGGTP